MKLNKEKKNASIELVYDDTSVYNYVKHAMVILDEAEDKINSLGPIEIKVKREVSRYGY